MGSVTFSEKIVDINRSGLSLKVLMIVCWSLLLLAIVTCGLGLAQIAAAGGIASYSPLYDYHSLENSAVRMFIVSGVAFGAGLLTLLGAGTVSLLEKGQ